MKVIPFLLSLSLLLLTGCFPSIDITHFTPRPVPYHVDEHEYDHDPEPDHHGHRTPLSSFRSSSQVWAVDGRFHDGPNCEKAFKKRNGEFVFFTDVRRSGLRPCRFCIDVNR